MSKAEQKRTEDTIKLFKANLNRSLITFKNKYLQDYSDWNISKTENNLIRIKETEKDFIDGWKKEDLIKSIEKRLSLKAILNLTFFTEANDSYNKNIDNLSKKLTNYGFNTNFRIKYIHKDFSFLITDSIGTEVHARIIYACGDVNAPHYRFITTKRN